MSQEKRPLRVAIIGTAARSDYLYGPILQALPHEVELVSVWGRSEASAQRLGETLQAPWYTDLDRLVRETAPEIGIVSVAYGANGEVGLAAVEAGLHVLLETPIAHKLAEADAIIAAAEQRGRKIEIAEQFHRRPLEQIKLALIKSGLFGRVHSSFSDFAGHGYHGISVMRSYLGFDARPVQVVGSVHKYPLAAQWSRLSDTRGERTEEQEHGMIEFDGGQLGIFHWTSVGYDSPLRWWRSSRFLAEHGMGITVGVNLEVQEWLTLLAPGGEAPRFVTIERRWERNDGGALIAMVAHTGDAGPADRALGQPLPPRPQGPRPAVARRRDRRRRLPAQPGQRGARQHRAHLRPLPGTRGPGADPRHPPVLRHWRRARQAAARPRTADAVELRGRQCVPAS